MAEELKNLTEDLDKDQPLTGDSLALLQGAQARRRAHRAPRCARAAITTARVTATVANQPVEDAAALDAIDRDAGGRQDHFVFDVATGPVYRVTDLAIQGPPDIVGYPGLDRSKLTLGAGQARRRADDPGDRGGDPRARCAASGYALAAVAQREVLIDHATREANVTFVDRSRDRSRMGPVRFSGTEKVDTVYLQRRVPFEEGDPYAPAKVNALRDRLTSLGIFSVGARQARDGARRQGRAADRRRAARTGRRARSASA